MFKAMEGLNPRQTENSFRQSQTILRDLKHHSLPKRHYSFWEQLSRSLDLPVQPLFANIVYVRFECQLSWELRDDQLHESSST